MMMYVLFGGMTATTGCRSSRPACCSFGATFMAVSVLMQFGFSPEALFSKAVEVLRRRIPSWPRRSDQGSISAVSVGMALMFGTAGHCRAS